MQEVDKPTLQKDHALLRILRIGICGTDLHAFEGTQLYFSYPKILGHELAAELVDIDGSSEFQRGLEKFISTVYSEQLHYAYILEPLLVFFTNKPPFLYH